ncbi:MAG: hypothetical protein B6D56_02460 [Candidatus Omnitrophica bacterium 4484_70.1]|nr:MAG: hypothetical protein B6D56_02460 [Candidatus Omnitrophica bacterium 4484_70.1]
MHDDADTTSDIEMSALNDLYLYDKVKLDAAGFISLAKSESFITAQPVDASINIGDGAFLKSWGDARFFARTNADIKTQANTSTYGLAAAGQGKSKALAEAEDSITVGANAEVIATKELYFLAGADMNGLGVLEVKANTDVFNKTAFAYSGSPDADATARHFSTIETKKGSHLASGGHMTIEADKGFLFANGNGKATDASRKALEKFAELFGADAEGAFNTIAGTSVNEGTGALVLNGTLETGIYRKLYLTFGKDVFNPYYKTEDGSKGRHTIAFDEEETGKWWVYVYNADEDRWDRSWELIPDEQSEGISWTILTDQRIADNIQAEIERLENVKKQYGANSELSRDIDSRLTILRAQLEAQKSGEYTDIIKVKPAYAASGNVNLWADYVVGSGSISAPGDVEIKITNNSPLPLKLDTLTIPDEMGGQIKFNNRRVRSSSDIENANKNAPGGTQVSLSLTDALNSPPPVIEVKNTFDKDSGVYNPENIPDMNDPALFVSGEINNLNGLVKIDNDTGSIIATAGIRADTIELSAGGDFIFDSPETLFNTGPNPAAAFKYIAEAYENDYPSKPAYHGQEPSDSFQIAGNNLYINADTVNINGVIQSGLPDKVITITQGDVNAGYNKVNASGERFVKIVEVNEQLDGRGVVIGGISAELDTENNQITILGTEIQGGKVFISGRIVSTGNGKINVIDGYGRIVIDNQSNLPVVLKKIDTAGVEGKVVLIDKAKDNGTGLALVTQYERIGNEVRVYTNEGINSSIATKLISTSSGRKAIYQPLENMRYFWMTGKATSTQTIKKWYKEHDKFLGFIPVSKRSFTDSDYVSDSEGTYWYWHPGSWWHPPYPAKKTWWRRTQIWDKGENTYNYHSVKADCPINISFIGYDQGEVTVKSGGNIFVKGTIHNEGGITTLTSTSGNLINATSVGSIQSARINLTAGGTIGSQSSYLRITHSRGNILNAIAGGDIYLESASGDLMVTTLSTDNGSVGLVADQNLLFSGKVSLIKGKNISLEARRGAIGTSDNIIRIDTDSESCGKVRIVAHNGDVNVVEVSGDLYIDQIEAQGSVTLIVPGDVIDANTNEKKDTRTREELLALWDDMMLTGSAAEKKKESQWEAYRRSQDEAYQNYWRNKRNLRRNKNGNYTYDPYDSDVTFSYTEEERNSLKDAGWSEEDIRKEEEKMTQRYREWGQSDYDPNFSYVLSDKEKDDLSSGYFWTEKELQDSLPSFVETHDTTLSIEEPNIIGRSVTITAGGKIGSDKEDIFYYYSNPDMYSEQEKEDIKVAIAAAERDDLEWKEGEKLLIIHLREDVDIHASGNISLAATGHIFLGGEQDVNLYAINSGGRIRIKVGGGIYNPRADMKNNIVGSDSLILEASDGAIGSSGFPIRITLQGNTPYVTARASGDIYLTETAGDFYIDLVNTDDDVELISQQGGIYDWLEDLNTDIYADNISLRGLKDIGKGEDNYRALDIEMTDTNGQLILNTSRGGANIFSTRDVNLGESNVWGTFRLESMGAIEVQGDVSAGGDVSFVSGGNITFWAALIAANSTVNLNPSGNNIQDSDEKSYLQAKHLIINNAANIGSSDADLDTRLSDVKIDATGDIYITEVPSGGALSLKDISARGINISTTSGNLNLYTDYTITAQGEVNLNSSDDLTLNGTINAPSQVVNLFAGEDILDISDGTTYITAEILNVISAQNIGTSGDNYELDIDVNTLNITSIAGSGYIKELNDITFNLLDLKENLMLTAGGAIRGIEANKISAGKIILIANDGIGEVGGIPLNVDTPSSNTIIAINNHTGSIHIVNNSPTVTFENIINNASNEPISLISQGKSYFNNVISNNGDITLTAGADAFFNYIEAGSATIKVDSSGVIEELNNDSEAEFVALSLDLDARNGIGTLDTLEISATTISADNSGTGAINLLNIPLADTSVTSLSTQTGDINFTQEGLRSLTINSAVTNIAGNINILNNGGDLIVDTITAQGRGKDITLATFVSGDIALGVLTAGDDRIILTSGGAITDTNGPANNIISANLIMSSFSGIGAEEPIETTVSNLDATNTDNAIRIVNNGQLNLIDLNGDGYSVNNLNGKIEIFASSPLNIQDAVSSGTDITLEATEDGGDDDHLTISADVISAGGGLITLNSGADFLQTAGMITTTGNVEINADYDGGGKGDITQSGGSISANMLYIRTPETVTLVQTINDVNYLNAFSTVSGNINFVDIDDIDLTYVHTTCGNIDIFSGGWLMATDVQATDGNINLDADGKITATLVKITDGAITGGYDINLHTTSGGVDLLNIIGDNDITVLAESGDVRIDNIATENHIQIIVSTGKIAEYEVDAEVDITSNELILSAADGIGSSDNAIETEVDNLDTVNTNNNIQIINTGKLNLKDLNIDGYAVNNIKGSTTIIATSSLNIQDTVSSGTDITFEATEDGGDSDHLTVSADVQSTRGGLLTFNAGANFLQTAGMITTTGNVEINADYDGSGKGSVIQSGGLIIATTLIASAPEDIILTQPNNDVVNLDASSTVLGDIDYRDKNAINLIDVDTANGMITVNAEGKIIATDVDTSATDNGINNISLTSVTARIQAIWINAGSKNDVFLTASQGDISQDGIPACDVRTDELHINAQKGIDLDTQSNVLVADNFLSGDIVIDNIGDLYARDVDNKGGDVRITTHSDLFVGDIQAQGSNNVYLNAATGNIQDDLFADPDDLNYIRGNLVDLSALENIGDMAVSNGDIDVRANTINASAGGEVFIEGEGEILFNNISAGGRVYLTTYGSIVLGSIRSNGFIDIRVFQGDITVTTGTITSHNSGVRLTTGTGSIYAQGPGPHIIAGDDSFLNAPEGKISPLPGAPLNVSIKGDLYLDIANLSITYPTRENYGNLIGTIAPLNTPILIPTRFSDPLNPPGFVYFNAKQIWPPKSNADYQWLAQLVVTRYKPFIARYRHRFYNNPRYPQEAARVRGDYFESLEGSRFVSIEPATPLLYAYHPLTPVDASAFEQIVLDVGAYEFIENRIKLKGDIFPYLLYPHQKKEKKKDKSI